MAQHDKDPHDPITFNLGHDVRSFLDYDRKRWFLLCDVRKALELRNPEYIQKEAIRSARIIDAMGRKKIVRCLPEASVVDMLLRSYKPVAKDFQAWFKEHVVSKDARSRAVPWAVSSGTLIDADLIFEFESDIS